MAAGPRQLRRSRRRRAQQLLPLVARLVADLSCLLPLMLRASSRMMACRIARCRQSRVTGAVELLSRPCS